MCEVKKKLNSHLTVIKKNCIWNYYITTICFPLLKQQRKKTQNLYKISLEQVGS